MRVTIASRLETFTVDVGQQEPVLEIKRKIEHVLGIPIAAQTLSIFDWELIDGLDMEDYPIVKEGTRINLTINPNLMHPPPLIYNREKINILVKFSSKHLNIEVDATETVRSLKERIHIIEGNPMRRMSLYFCGIELEEDFRTLSELGVREFSEIIVYFKSNVNPLRDNPPTKRIQFVVQTFSSFLNAASFPLEMNDSSTVDEMKRLLMSSKILPGDDYLFIHKQRIMRDNCSLKWHGVENGDLLYVFQGTVCRDPY
ncbi:hypothetical protein ACFE04_017609 [Oxalis oulophora]